MIMPGKNPFKIGALISGSGTNLEAIIKACESGQINGRVVFTGSDNPEASGLQRAAGRNIDCFVTDYRKILENCRKNPEKINLPPDFDLADIRGKQAFFSPDTNPDKTDYFLRTRAVAEAELLEKMKPYPFDLLVLAGFMRNLSPYFIDRVNTDRNHPRIMNIHPAILPAFAGTDGYGDTFRHGCKVGGCTVHFIDYGEDSGPIIGQRCFSIDETDTIDDIKEKGLQEEWRLYPECIRLFSENRLQVVNMTHRLANGKIFQRKVVKIAK